MKETTIYALGYFDGVHLGHQALLKACCALAKAGNHHAGVVTFTSHPDTLVLGKTPPLINTVADRRFLLQSYGIDTILELPFDKALMETSWQDFLQSLENAAGFVCGSDFRFGAKGAGNAQLLASWCKERALPYAVLEQQVLDGIRVSSSHIRTLLEQGKMETARHFFGHPHTLSGTVVPGHQLGRTIEVPTANLVLPPELLCPKHGVYACLAHVEGATYPAVTNIGSRPTVGGKHITIETYLLDFGGDLYGKKLRLDFFAYLRPEQKFPSLADLQAEIYKNAAQARKILENS